MTREVTNLISAWIYVKLQLYQMRIITLDNSCECRRNVANNAMLQCVLKHEVGIPMTHVKHYS